jgi:hypothetical protein
MFAKGFGIEKKEDVQHEIRCQTTDNKLSDDVFLGYGRDVQIH